MLIDISNGEIVHWLHLDGVVEEIFDVVVLGGDKAKPNTVQLRLKTKTGLAGVGWLN